ncbi:glutamine synthetase family protein [bacterium]|nr:glutamine synthetase family protein [bacterium]
MITMADIEAKVKEHNIRFVMLQFSDLLGMVKSATVTTAYFYEAVRHGNWFDGSSIEGFARIAESDMLLQPDVETFQVLPWIDAEYGKIGRVICDVYNPDMTPFEGDPRYILKRALAEAKDMGYLYNTGPELEFFLFKAKNGLRPLPHDVGSYYDMVSDLAFSIRLEMMAVLEEIGINVIISHHEVAPGQHEICFRYENALRTAENGVTMRMAIKAIAAKHDLHATFMPKPLMGENGSGMHVHQSLFSVETGKNAFYRAKDKYKLSSIAKRFIAGQLAEAKGMSAILSPTVNSYKRLVPGYEAPVYISWANTNRSALIRIPRPTKGRPKTLRCELRCPDPSCNIYLAFAVMLQAGLKGIKEYLEVPNPVEENIYELGEAHRSKRKIETLHSSLYEALYYMRKSKVVKDALGQLTFERYLNAKTEEWNDYNAQVTPWEHDRYLEKY